MKVPQNFVFFLSTINFVKNLGGGGLSPLSPPVNYTLVIAYHTTHYPNALLSLENSMAPTTLLLDMLACKHAN